MGARLLHAKAVVLAALYNMEGCYMFGYQRCLVVWKPLSLDPLNRVFGWSTLAAVLYDMKGSCSCPGEVYDTTD